MPAVARPVENPLSPAQLRAFSAYLYTLSNGEGQKQAAADCGIAYQTFRNSVEEAYRRLGVTNVIQAAIALGMIRWSAGFPRVGRSESLVSQDDPAGAQSDETR